MQVDTVDRAHRAVGFAEAGDIEDRQPAHLRFSRKDQKRPISGANPLGNQNTSTEQEEAVGDHAQFRRDAQRFGEADEQQAAEDHTRDRPRPAAEHDDQHRRRIVHLEGQRADHGQVMRIEAAAQAGKGRADHEDHQLVVPGRNAHGFGQRLVLANGDHVAPGRRAHDQIDGQGRQRGDDKHQIVEADDSGDRERGRSQREVRLWDRRQAHVAARQADPVLGDRLPDDDEAERAHHERCRAQPQRWNAERQGNGTGHQPRGEEIQVERRAEMDRQQRRRIGADTEERRLRQRQQAGIAEQQIETMRRQQEDQRNDDRMQRVIAEEQRRDAGQRDQREAEGNAKIPARRRSRAFGWCHALVSDDLGHVTSDGNQKRACAENSPCGRHISTSIRVAKPTVSRNCRPT